MFVYPVVVWITWLTLPVLFRMCILDTGLKLIRMWWEGLMKGKYSLYWWFWVHHVFNLTKFCCICTRFILSLASCKNCIVINDQLNILPVSSHMSNIKPVPPKTQVLYTLSMTVIRTRNALDASWLMRTCLLCSSQEDGLSPREQELKDLKESLQDTQPVGVLVDRCRTMDQVEIDLLLIIHHIWQPRPRSFKVIKHL